MTAARTHCDKEAYNSWQFLVVDWIDYQLHTNRTSTKRPTGVHQYYRLEAQCQATKKHVIRKQFLANLRREESLMEQENQEMKTPRRSDNWTGTVLSCFCTDSPHTTGGWEKTRLKPWKRRGRRQASSSDSSWGIFWNWADGCAMLLKLQRVIRTPHQGATDKSIQWFGISGVNQVENG